MVVRFNGAGRLFGTKIGNEFVQLSFDFTIRFFAHAVKEHHSVQMIVLVHQDPRKEVFDSSLNRVARQIIGTDTNRFRPFHFTVHTRQAETSFPHRFGAFGKLQFGVDQDEFFAFAANSTFVGHKHSDRQVDLVGGQSDPFMLVHQIEHLCGKISQLLVDPSDRLALKTQRRMRVVDDLEIHMTMLYAFGSLTCYLFETKMTDCRDFGQGPSLDNEGSKRHDCRMLNQKTAAAFGRYCDRSAIDRTRESHVAGATILDAGIDTPGSIAAGIALARLCMAELAEISIVSGNAPDFPVDNAVLVRTDHAVQTCLGCQYAGWPVQTDDFFAMGSGPMRLLRGREPMLKSLELSEQFDTAVGVLESDKLPTESAINMIADECGVSADHVRLAVAPSTSIAGTIQVVARAIETSLHKLHELDFDVGSVVSSTGVAPLPPPAKRGDTVAGIGRTNDAILYGGHVTLWVDCEEDAIRPIIDRVPSCSSSDHGRPFANVFKEYDYDFYKVDPLLFSPAVITIHNLRSGQTHRSGTVRADVLSQSFLS